MQRDPLGYVDGMSGYNSYAGLMVGLDPSGNDFIAVADRGVGGAR